jgi:hypothetical protein
VADQTEIAELRKRCDSLAQEAAGARDALADLEGELRDLAAAEDTGKTTTVLLAEHQRLLDQYTYRDRLLVQEFYFSIAATGLALNLVASRLSSALGAIVCLAMVLLNAGLWIHIAHLRTDRDLMWAEARELEAMLGMNVLSRIYQEGYRAGLKKRLFSGTRLMVNTVGAFSLFWVIALGNFLLAVDAGR